MYFMLIKALLPIGLLASANVPQSAKISQAQSPSSDSTLLTLGEIDGESTSDLSMITIRLDQAPSWQNASPLQNHGSFFQLTLPSTIVPEPGKFYDGGNRFFPKIGAFQVSPSDAAIRLFGAPEYDLSDLGKAIKTEILGSRIVITIDHNLAPRPADREKKEDIGPPNLTDKLTAEQVIAKTKVREDIPAPADIVKSTLTGTPSSSRNYLTKLATGGAFLTVLILVSIGLRTVLRKRGEALQKLDPGIALKTLATMPLAPRQKVSVIQVGHEKILLGVTADSITFLTTLSAQDQNRTSAPKLTPTAAPQLPHSVSSTDQLSAPVRRKNNPSTPTRGFSDIVHDADQTLSLKSAPRLKQIPGNDEETLRNSVSPERSPKIDLPSQKSQDSMPTTKGHRINIGVGEEGIKQMPRTREPKKAAIASTPNQETIDDVTRLIREKLKNLKTI